MKPEGLVRIKGTDDIVDTFITAKNDTEIYQKVHRIGYGYDETFEQRRKRTILETEVKHEKT